MLYTSHWQMERMMASSGIKAGDIYSTNGIQLLMLLGCIWDCVV